MNATTCILIAVQLFAAPISGACALFTPGECGRADHAALTTSLPADAYCESMQTCEDCPAGAVQDQSSDTARKVSIDPGIFLGLLPSGSESLTVDHGLCAGRSAFSASLAASTASLQAQHIRLQI